MSYFPLLGEMYELVVIIYIITLLYVSSSIKYLIKNNIFLICNQPKRR